jgi:endonuclease/exonuclease/phosphatase family metal-dependent hydrolase
MIGRAKQTKSAADRARIVLLLALAASDGPAPAAAQSADLRVMSFNIRYGTAADGENRWPLRRALLIDVIRDAAPAVLGVQEALGFQLEEVRAGLGRYAQAGVGRDDGALQGEYSAILYDTTRVALIEEGTFWFSDSPALPGSTGWGNTIPRICTWARFRDRTDGATFRVYNVHWDHVSQPSRERSAALLLATIAAREPAHDPVIVSGDFNAGESNPAFVALTASTRVPLRDTFRALHEDSMAVGTFHGFRGGTGGDKIDGILVGPGWVVVSAAIVRTAVEGRYPSDHYPVTAALRRQARPPPSSRNAARFFASAR